MFCSVLQGSSNIKKQLKTQLRTAQVTCQQQLSSINTELYSPQQVFLQPMWGSYINTFSQKRFKLHICLMSRDQLHSVFSQKSSEFHTHFIRSIYQTIFCLPTKFHCQLEGNSSRKVTDKEIMNTCNKKNQLHRSNPGRSLNCSRASCSRAS